MNNNNLVLAYKLYIIAFVFTALAMFPQIAPLNATTHFKETIGISTNNIVNLTSLYFITYAILQIPGGILFDTYGVKYIIPIYLLLTTLGIILYWFSSNCFVLGLSRLITGAGCSVAYISGIFISIKYLPPKWLMLFIGGMESGSTLGSILALKPLKLLLNTFGWTITGYIIISFCAVLFIWSLTVIRKLTHTTNLQINIVNAYKCAFSLLKNKALLAMFIYSFATWLVIMSFAGYWLKDYLVHVHKCSETESLTLLQLCWFSFIISSMMISAMIKKLSVSKLAISILAGIGFATYAIMSIPIVFNYTETAIILILNGASTAGIIIAFSLIPKLAPTKSSGAAVAMNNVFIVMGGFTGQVLFGYILNNIDIGHIITWYDFSNLETPYYTGLLIYPIFTLIAFLAILYAVFMGRYRSN